MKKIVATLILVILWVAAGSTILWNLIIEPCMDLGSKFGIIGVIVWLIVITIAIFIFHGICKLIDWCFDAYKSQQPKEQSPWISVEDRPLFTVDENGIWEITEDGEEEFLAAIPYIDKNKPNEILWWIRHCEIDYQNGLCIVVDDYNEPAGWEIDQIQYWMPITKPPKP